MGRARSQSRAVAAVGNFNTVLGRSRGSAAAQARRDAAEDELVTERWLAQFPGHWENGAASIIAEGRDRAQTVEDLLVYTRVKGPLDLNLVVRQGDVTQFAERRAYARDALARYFEEFSSDEQPLEVAFSGFDVSSSQWRLLKVDGGRSVRFVGQLHRVGEKNVPGGLVRRWDPDAGFVLFDLQANPVSDEQLRSFMEVVAESSAGALLAVSIEEEFIKATKIMSSSKIKVRTSRDEDGRVVVSDWLECERNWPSSAGAKGRRSRATS
jgi:hypothetical protein